MRAFFLTIILLLPLSGCVFPGMQGSFSNDPLTGGVNTQVSSLLNVPLPAGLQRYPSHSHMETGSEGPQGLETLRGGLSANTVAIKMFNTLKAAGWQLRMYNKFGQRSVYLYEKNREYALLAFHPQNLLTILEIWLGPKLPDGAELSLPAAEPEENPPSIAGEEYGPQGSFSSQTGKVETWGDSSNIEEHEL